MLLLPLACSMDAPAYGAPPPDCDVEAPSECPDGLVPCDGSRPCTQESPYPDWCGELECMDPDSPTYEEICAATPEPACPGGSVEVGVCIDGLECFTRRVECKEPILCQETLTPCRARFFPACSRPLTCPHASTEVAKCGDTAVCATIEACATTIVCELDTAALECPDGWAQHAPCAKGPECLEATHGGRTIWCELGCGRACPDGWEQGVCTADEECITVSGGALPLECVRK